MRLLMYSSAMCAFLIIVSHFLFLSLPGRRFFQVDDVIDSDQRNYIYEFNACAPAAGVPAACALEGGAPAPAYQVFNDSSNRCVQLGLLAQSSWSLIDDTNPALGTVLAYEGGETCTLPGGVTKPRSLGVFFRCAAATCLMPTTRVKEEACEYEVRFLFNYSIESASIAL
jgi:hypothetical protein